MNEFKVGLLALAAIFAVVYMSLKVTSNQSGFGEYVTYRTIIDDASGIFAKTPIKIAGINAGRIKNVELQGNLALISFEVLRRIKITEDSRLRIRSVGFLGDKFLEISPGKSEKPLAEFGLIRSETAGGIENLARDAAEVISEVKKIVTSLRESLAPEGGISPIKQIVADIHELTKNAKEASTVLRDILVENQDRVNAMMANLESFSQRLNRQLDPNDKASMLASLNEIMGNAKQMTDDLKALASDLRKGKGTLGKILVEERIADDVQQTLSGVKKMVNRVEAIRTEIALYTGANTDKGGTTDAMLNIFPSPERFYSIGITTSKWGPTAERETKTVLNNGTETTEVKKERSKNSFRFNAQLGRKIQNWSLRAGLIESTGGVGFDYELANLRTRFSSEFFDYRENLGINVRLSSEVHVWNVLYGRVAGDDLALKTRSATISAGLRFNDEDLKGLLGFLW